ncbi:MAG: threonine/serine exporter family protein [Lachnospiraceae bacterium]|nr:threonine/serine exporter family protein [Lachnospiraceae bacterium]
MRYAVQILMAIGGAVGFALMFNMRGKRLMIAGIGGAITWGAYLTMFAMSDKKFVACLTATIVCMIFAEVMARVTKTPVIILLVPMLVPLVPGGDLYYMMSNIIMDNSALAREYGQTLIMEVGAIAFGIILVSTGLQIYQRIKQFREGASN